MSLELADAVRAGDRRALARAITLVESTRADHRDDAIALLEDLMPGTGTATRVGISGAPGAGKSTFIETLGLHLVDTGQCVAVLAVDPSSTRTGGSILGDKTRMEQLSRRPEAFIRPSPSGGTLGGVSRAALVRRCWCARRPVSTWCSSRRWAWANPRWRSRAWSTCSCSSSHRVPATSCRV